MQFLDYDLFLSFVDRFDRFDHSHRIAVFAGGTGQGLDIFREAGAAVSAARIEEFRTDAGVCADTFPYHIDIRSYQIAQVGDVVHEGDACSQHGIGRVFGHLGRGNVHEVEPVVVHLERTVKPFHDLFCPVALYADDHTIGRHEVLDRCAFLEKFGVRSHFEIDLLAAFGQLFLDDGLDFFCRTYRYGGLGDQNRVFFDVLTESPGYFEYVLQVGRIP